MSENYSWITDASKMSASVCARLAGRHAKCVRNGIASNLTEEDFEKAIKEIFVEYLNSSKQSPNEFPYNSRVSVDHPRYHGEGIVQYDSGPRKRVIGVLLENGNVWEYEAETVTLIEPKP